MRRFSWVFLILCACTFSLSASGEQPNPMRITLGADSSLSWYRAYVEDDEDIPFRSAIALSINPTFGFTFPHWGIHTFIPVSIVSTSKEFGGKELKPLLGIGLGLEGEIYFDRHFGVKGSASLSQGWYLSRDNGNFIAFSFAIAPFANVIRNNNGRLVLSLPIRLDLRDGVVAPQTGVGVAYYWEV